jgi:hypothetical protein
MWMPREFEQIQWDNVHMPGGDRVASASHTSGSCGRWVCSIKCTNMTMAGQSVNLLSMRAGMMVFATYGNLSAFPMF